MEKNYSILTVEQLQDEAIALKERLFNIDMKDKWDRADYALYDEVWNEFSIVNNLILRKMENAKTESEVL